MPCEVAPLLASFIAVGPERLIEPGDSILIGLQPAGILQLQENQKATLWIVV